MGAKTSIEWVATVQPDGMTTPGSSWNPIRGTVGKWTCVRTSPGCEHCYSETLNRRFGGPMFQVGKDIARLDEKALTDPARWRKPRKIFVGSMTDLFGEWVPDEWLDRIFAVIAMNPQHTYIVLTKRAKRMRDYLSNLETRERIFRHTGNDEDGYRIPLGTWSWPLRQVWAGVSVEDQKRADERIPLLLQTPAAVRWLSCEPLLGPVDLLGDIDGDQERLGPAVWVTPYQTWTDYGYEHDVDLQVGIDWVVCGSESGSGARPAEMDWFRSLRDQCKAASVPFFLKQFAVNGHKVSTPELDGERWTEFPAITG